MYMTRYSTPDENGFTLVELLISIVILGIIAVPLSNVVVSFFKHSAATTARLSESSDQQIATAYWQEDVASLGLRSTAYNSAPSVHSYELQQSINTPLACSLPLGSPVIALAWDQFDSPGPGTRIDVAYLSRPAGTRFELVRVQCQGSTVDSTATLARTLLAPPTVSCTGGGVTSCDDSSGAVATRVVLTMNVRDASDKGEEYTVKLSGQRRQS
jgi:prepilin-type N-terminal cleavage/methylation domain-containing protein